MDEFIALFKMSIRHATPEKSLAIYNEKSSFIIDGCNIFVMDNRVI